MGKFRKILKTAAALLMVAAFVITMCVPAGVLKANDINEDFESDMLGSGYYGKELNSQGYKVQVTSYKDGVTYSVFNEGILRYQDSYVFCYDPNKRFRETDNVSFYEEVPKEFTKEQGRTIALMIHYILHNYDIQGPDGAINYYLGQCAIWNYINSVNPSYNPYRIYITDSSSIYTVAQQEEALNTILAWVDANKDKYNTYLQYWINNDGDYQPVLYGGAVPKPVNGYIEVQKSSACPALTEENDNYSLKGAIYGIYKSREDAENDNARVSVITTDDGGIGTSENLPLGTYYVKEVTASKGFTLDSNIYTAEIVYDNAVNITIPSVVISSIEKPKLDKASLVVIKKDDESDEGYKKLYLEGAVFEVKYYAAESENGISDATYKRHWFFKTGADGRAYFKEEYLTSFDDMTSDAFYTEDANETVLPLGYITLQEVKEPEGYVLDNEVRVYKVDSDISEAQLENQRIIENTEKKQAFQLIKLAEDGSSEPKPLVNVGFMACKVSDLSFDSDGNYIFDESKAVNLAADGSREMFTDETGYAISSELRYGKYLIHETTVPIGYLPVADFYVNISDDSRTPQEIIYKTDKQKKYYLRVTKIDNTTKRAILNNSSTYKIWSYKDKDYVSFDTYTGSEIESVSEFKTNEDGVLITPGALTYGDYKLIECKAPIGYNIDSPEGIDFSIDDKTIYITTDISGDTVNIVDITYADTQMLGNLSILKTGEIREYDEEKKEFVTKVLPLNNIEFGLYADEDIYSLDGNGEKLYEKGELVCTLATDDEGKVSKGDIPFGKYVVKELNTPDDFIKSEDIEIEFNIGDVVNDTDDISSMDKSVEVLNKAYYPELKTTACDKNTGKHLGSAGGKTVVTIVDKVDCTNLVVGRNYVVKGKLYDTTTGAVWLDSDGNEVTSELEFKADSKNQTVNLEFTFDGDKLGGQTITVFEELYYNEKLVAMHADISDKDQQVHYPSIGTTAKNAVDGGKVVAPEQKVTLNDTVEISNIDIGEDFIIRGVVYDKSTGEKLLVDGKEVWAYSEFTAVDENMKTDVVFTFDASELAGKSVVLYEYMYTTDEQGGEVLVASHEDINYEGQTIVFSDEPKTGDKGFSWIIIIMIVSGVSAVLLIFKIKKIK